jgi:VWFA-related protein
MLAAVRIRARVWAAVVAAVVWQAPAGAQQTPVFRASVARVAVDVQVVDRDGDPVLGLDASDFSVTVGGRSRRVVSADLIKSGFTDPWAARVDVTRSDADPALAAPLPSYRRRVVVAVDSSSLDAGGWQRTLPAVREFVADLDRDDWVGLFVSPFGPVIAPGSDRAVIQRALTAIVPRGQPFDTQFNLTPAEVVDIMAESVMLNTPGTALRRNLTASLDEGMDAPTVGRVQRRECPNDFDCRGRILLDASNAVSDLEARAMQSLTGVELMFGAVASWPGRKTVLLVSGGVLTSDRPGGRPDVGDMARALGRHVAASESVIYAVLVDNAFHRAFSAADRIMAVPGLGEVRETRMLSQWLEQFSDAAGGALFRAQADHGDAAFDRIRREMAAFYLLGVEPGPEDRDGRPRALRVSVERQGASVRHRRWVALPPESAGP